MVAPCLLRQLSFDTVSLAGSFARGGAPEPARRLPLARSFFGWLVVHAAGHVEQLHLCIGTPYNNEADTAAFFPEIASALAACGGGLREVRLYLQLRHLRFPAALAAALRGVRLLHLEVEEGDLTLDVPLGGMRQLEQLWLQGSPSDASSAGLEVAASASLPPSLTQLHLGGTRWDPGEDAALLPQVRAAAGFGLPVGCCAPQLQRIAVLDCPSAAAARR